MCGAAWPCNAPKFERICAEDNEETSEVFNTISKEPILLFQSQCTHHQNISNFAASLQGADYLDR